MTPPRADRPLAPVAIASARARPEAPERIEARLRELASTDRQALYQLAMHCRDRGHAIAPFARRRLAELGLIDAKAIAPEDVRAEVLGAVRGFGLRMTVGGERAPVSPDSRDDFGDRIADLAERGDRERAARELVDAARKMARSGGVFDAREMSRWAAAASSLAEQKHGRATRELQSAMSEVERLEPAFSRRAKPIFTELVAETGGSLAGPISLPRRHVPYWLKGPHPLAGFQSRPELPKEADIVIMGAGLTGGSAAYHLSRIAQRRGLKVVVLEAKDPATEASGKNGGNFELIPENFFGAYGTYDGLEAERFKFLRASYPDQPESVLRRQARRTAEAIVDFALTNARRMRRTIERERIDCDFSPAGWLRTSWNEREIEGTLADAALAAERGGKMEVLDEKAIADRYSFPAPFGGRIIHDNGNYHPFKLVCGELKAAIDRGVELYTRTPVRKVSSVKKDLHLVETGRGTIRAKKVIVATNAFTSQIFPELAAIRPFRSQISSYKHVEDRLDGASVTAKDGDIYANYPGEDRYLGEDGVRRGTLNVGNDVDTEIPTPNKVLPSRRVFARGRPEIVRHFPMIEGKPSIRAWGGAMAFVEGAHGMRLPALGPLGEGPRSGVFVAVWCNGYGGTGCHNAGAGAARWAITDRIPKDMPQDIFGPARLFTDQPLFDTEDSD
jgi:glycine/D-amino acid oxidase-like deaminating enzyme